MMQPTKTSRLFRLRPILLRVAVWALTIFVFLALWECAVRMGPLARVAAAPSGIAQWSVQHWDRLLYHAPTTLWETLSGFLIALILALVLGLAIHAVPSWRSGAITLTAALNSLPKVVFAPLLFVFLGYEMAPKIAMAALIAFFPILIGFLHGLELVDPSMELFLATTAAPRWRIFLRVRLPWALRTTVSGCKVAIGLALVGALVSELINARRGLAYLLRTGDDNFDLNMYYAGIVAACIMGIVLYLALECLDAFFLSRFPPVRASNRTEKWPKSQIA